MALTVSYQTAFVGGDATGDFQTNSYETGDQLLPDVLGLSGGGFVSAYNNVSPIDGFILLNFFRADHSLIGTHREAFDSNATDAWLQPKLTELANGNLLVVWDDNNTADGDAGPQASIFTDKGVVVARDMNLGASVGFQDVDVAALDNGGFVLSYRDAGDIKYRTFNAAGAQTTGPNVVTSAAGTQFDSQVIVLSDGGFAIAWTDTNPADQLVKARVFDADGTPRGAEFSVSGNNGDNTEPSIAAGKNGELIVVSTSTGWDENSVTGDPGISLVIYDFATDEVSYTHVNEEHTGDESGADVTVLANGYAAVTWTRPTSSDDIFCRIFDADGGAVTDEFLIATSLQEETASAVSAMLGGLFITSWQDETSDGSGGSIASQVTELTRTVLGDAAANLHIGDELRESIDGMAADDTVRAEGGEDTVNGGSGDDTINGAGGDDVLDGGTSSDLVLGGDGDDLAQGGLNADTVSGGDGDDRIYAGSQADPFSSIEGDEIMAGAGADTVVGSGGGDTVLGGDGDDVVSGGEGNDSVDGEGGSDRIRGLAGDDIISGFGGSDTINGGAGEDSIYADVSYDDASIDGDVLSGANGNDTIGGASGNDVIAGQGRKDRLFGSDGDDTMNGGSDKDLLRGDLGADRLTGGSEKDVFAFQFLSDSANGAEDVLTDCGNFDFIDLSGIDAKTGAAGDQAFSLVEAFGGHKGELVVEYHVTGIYAGFTTVQGDVNGDGAADFTIKIAGNVHKFDNFIF